MSTMQITLIAVIVMFMLVGLVLFFRGLKSKASQPAREDAAQKHGLPIVARQQRQFSDSDHGDDTASSASATQPLHSDASSHRDNYNHVDAVTATDIISQPTSEFQSHQQGYEYVRQQDYGQPDSQSNESSFSYHFDGSESDVHIHPADHEQHSDDKDYVQLEDDSDAVFAIHDDERQDAFLNLASATANILPVVEVSLEPEFTDNSPVIDQHLLSMTQQQQNSPLENAQGNINITLFPDNEYTHIEGELLFALFEKYGLRFGAMNMFHRYEYKDGTGILWFSVIGISDEGITPFNINLMPQSRYRGLALFLSLPHPNAMQGFDSMMSIANLMARDLKAHLYDEDNHPLTQEHKKQLRMQVQSSF